MSKELDDITTEIESIKKEFCIKEAEITGKNAEDIEREINNSIKDMNTSNNVYAKYMGFEFGKSEIKLKKEFGVLPFPGYFNINPIKIESYLLGYVMATNDRKRADEIRIEAQEKIVKKNDGWYWSNNSCARRCEHA